jgi:outer membrane biosynthesis protein TonB
VSDKEKKQDEQQEKSDKKPKVRKSFGNTIILFIIFFIIFTVLVTGVAFFADKFNIGGKAIVKDLEQLDPKTEMTDPEKGKSTEYVMDEKGNVGTKEEMDKIKQKDEAILKKEQEKKAITPIPELDKKKADPKPIPKADAKPAPKPKREAVKKPAVKKQAPAKKVAAKKATKTTRGEYVLQFASFQNKTYAQNEVRKLKRRYPDAEMVRVDLGAKGVWYRVRAFVGVSYAEAKKHAAEVARTTRYKPYPLKK